MKIAGKDIIEYRSVKELASSLEAQIDAEVSAARQYVDSNKGDADAFITAATMLATINKIFDTDYKLKFPLPE